jgi:hypothetical protein
MNSSVTKPSQQHERDAAVAVAEAEHEALERAAGLGAGERRIEVEALALSPREYELERVASARAAERGVDRDLAALAWRVPVEQRQRALERLEADRGAARRAGPVVAHHVIYAERDRPSPLGQLDRAIHRWLR